VTDSSLTMTLSQVRDLFVAPDWHPGDHPTLPEVVARGRKGVRMRLCHRADGPGGPENATLMGLPTDYIKQQIADFRSGARKSSVMNRAPTLKLTLAKAVTDEVMALAAAYLRLKPRRVIRVTESATVPKTIVAAWSRGRSRGRHGAHRRPDH
jgi:hypothetical protein